MIMSSRGLTVEEQKDTCKRVLYNRLRRVVPGLELTDIVEFEPLDDGTILFGARQTHVEVAEVDMPGPSSWGWYDEVPVHIRVMAPWAMIAWREGEMINCEPYLSDLIKQMVLRDLMPYLEDTFGHPTCPCLKEG